MSEGDKKLWPLFKQLGEDALEQRAKLERIDVKCPYCQCVMTSTIGWHQFPCIRCNGVITPNLHIVVKGEEEIN